jgi:hypothetical protein
MRVASGAFYERPRLIEVGLRPSGSESERVGLGRGRSTLDTEPVFFSM